MTKVYVGQASIVFQSSPDPCGPGVEVEAELEQEFKEFQSSPDPCGPGVRRGKARTAKPPRFNPRPTLAGRASSRCYPQARMTAVSILARPLRAGRQPAGREQSGSIVVSILARPLRAGRHLMITDRVVAAMFQSSPDPCGPGVGSRDDAGWRLPCFNPRPTLAGRASVDRRVIQPAIKVSILARPLRAGRRTCHGAKGHRLPFQSSPDPCGPGVGI